MILFSPEEFWTKLFQEDAPEGDKTSDSLAIPDFVRTAKIIAKSDLSLSGADFIFNHIPENLNVTTNIFFKDGQRVYTGQCIASLEGKWKNLLLLERPILNWLGHLSGIATQAWTFQEKVKHTKCKILDTRKTTPFYRTFEKKAVRDGGALNHRGHLSEALMLKENHLSLYNFDIPKAIEHCLTAHPDLHLTVEASNTAQVEPIAKTKAHRVMLDNFDNSQIKESVEIVKRINPKLEIEASGNMTLDRVQSVAELGVDFISVGALTHSAPHADITQLLEY